ncbi:MAG TPA: hypothetical protein VK815_11285 [Candidatus Acidoferrales bacterium]|jgi:hypothetical protein|nr:hypothetical protein [Candidatus Acidoferrales bacterium]
MSNFDKISLLLGIQLLLAAGLVGSFWATEGVAAFKGKIPKDQLAEHQNRMKPALFFLVMTFIVFDNLADFFRDKHWLSFASGCCFGLVCICYLIRSVITLRTRKGGPIRLKYLAWFEFACALMGMAVIAAMGAMHL